ncbi:MAG: hypothetical protein V4641_05555 [Pseudomonadota bacterium]
MADLFDNTPKPSPILPVGDVPAATTKAAMPKPLNVPAANPASTGVSSAQALTSPSTALSNAVNTPPRALPAPPNFIAGPNGVQANTPMAHVTTSLGAAPTAPSAAAQLTAAPAAPNYATTPGAGAVNSIDPVMPTRATVVPPSPTGGTTLGTVGGPAPNTGAPAGADISNDFAARTAAARAGVDAGGQPRFTPGTAAPAATAAGEVASDVAPAVGRLGQVTNAINGVVSNPAVAKVLNVGGKVLGSVGKLAGGVSALGEGLQTVGDINAGDTSAAVGHGATAAADLLATRFPNAATIGTSLAAHAIQSDPGHVATQALANALPNSGASQIDSQIADMKAQRTERMAKGLPVTPLADFTKSLQTLNAQRFALNPAETNDSSASTLTAPPAAAVPASGQPARTAPAAPAAAAGAPAPVTMITPYTSGAISPPDANGVSLTGADQAMKSNVAGTAVINGQVLTPQQIADAGKRLNTVSSDAFTNVAPGVLNSAATGGGTLSSAQALTQQPGLRGGKLFGTDVNGNPVGTTGGIGALAGTDRESTIQNLMGQISDALRNGKRGTARTLIDQMTAYDRASGTDKTLAQQQQDLLIGRQPKPLNDAEAAIQNAQATDAQMTTAQRTKMQGIEQKLATTTDQTSRRQLQQDLMVMQGKQPETVADKTIMMKYQLPAGPGEVPRTIELPYDTISGQFRIPEGYAQLPGLNGQSAAGQLKQP